VEDLLGFDLDNEKITICNYRACQCEASGEYALAEPIRKVLVNEQEYQIDLTTALGTKKQDRMSGEAGIAGALPS
jgi:bacterioferritin